MEARPSALVERVVGWLIPPAAREEVLGDLHERYSSTSRYLVEALCIVPFVILSRVRRTTDGLLWCVQAYALFLVFRPRQFGDDLRVLAHMAVPIGAALIALALRDAFRHPESHADDIDAAFDTSLKRAVVASGFAVAAACVPQAAFSLLGVGYAWTVPTLFQSAAGGFLMLIPVRITWEMQLRGAAHPRLAIGSVRRDAVTPEAWRSALQHRRDVLRKAWVWYAGPLTVVRIMGPAFRNGLGPWPLTIEMCLIAVQCALLRGLMHRLADLYQRDLDAFES